MRKTLKPSVEIPWTDKAVKEHIWKPIMKAQLNKDSTTQLTTKEIDEVFDTINKHMGEKFSLHTPFPSIDEVLFQQRIKKVAKNENGSEKLHG